MSWLLNAGQRLEQLYQQNAHPCFGCEIKKKTPNFIWRFESAPSLELTVVICRFTPYSSRSISDDAVACGPNSASIERPLVIQFPEDGSASFIDLVHSVGCPANVLNACRQRTSPTPRRVLFITVHVKIILFITLLT